jgi:hypothetical protein
MLYYFTPPRPRILWRLLIKVSQVLNWGWVHALNSYGISSGSARPISNTLLRGEGPSRVFSDGRASPVARKEALTPIPFFDA